MFCRFVDYIFTQSLPCETLLKIYPKRLLYFNITSSPCVSSLYKVFDAYFSSRQSIRLRSIASRTGILKNFQVKKFKLFKTFNQKTFKIELQSFYNGPLCQVNMSFNLYHPAEKLYDIQKPFDLLVFIIGRI